MVKQKELANLIHYEAVLKDKKKKISLAEAALRDKRANLLNRLKEGERVEKGELVASIEKTEGRASIKWKDELIKVKGEAFVEKLLQNAERPEKEELRVDKVVSK